MPVRVPRILPEGLERRSGAVPPWSHLPAELRAPITVARVRAAFATPFVERVSALARAAVLVPIYERDGECTVVFIRRAHSLTQNPGDMAFPGGHLEPGETPLDAALRETEEEVGLDRSLVEVIGELDVVERPRDAKHIAPFVGLIGAPPELIAAPSEVDAIVHVPLRALVADGVASEEIWVFDGAPREVRFFADTNHLGEDVVWGATGRIIWELLERILREAG